MENENIENNHLPIGHLVLELSKKFRNIVYEQSLKMGINGSYFFICIILTKNRNGLSQNEICEKLHLKAPTISLTLQAMERDGLLTREKDKEDSRKTIVKLTDKGYAYDIKIKEAHQYAEKKLVNSLNDTEFETFKNLLIKMNESLEVYKWLNF